MFLDERVVFGSEGLGPRIDLMDGVSDGGAKMGEAGRCRVGDYCDVPSLRRAGGISLCLWKGVRCVQ